MGKYNFNLRERLHKGIYKTRKLVKFNSFKSLAGLVILMLGLISGIYLVQQRQIIMKKAAESTFFTEGFESGFPSPGNWIVSGNGQAESVTNIRRSGSYSLKVTSTGSLESAVKDFGTDERGSFVIYVYDYGDEMSRGSGVSVSNAATDQYIILTIPSGGSTQYQYRINANTIDSGVERSVGWRKFEFVVNPKGQYGRVDDFPLSHLSLGSVV